VGDRCTHAFGRTRDDNDTIFKREFHGFDPLVR
jgi:hypothetical protein